jgi:hypothetical protein
MRLLFDELWPALEYLRRGTSDRNLRQLPSSVHVHLATAHGERSASPAILAGEVRICFFVSKLSFNCSRISV